MPHVGQIVGFAMKAPGFLIGWPDMQDFDRGLRVEVAMLPQINTGKTALTQQTNDAIVTKFSFRLTSSTRTSVDVQ
jgi:hypothetical protein